MNRLYTLLFILFPLFASAQNDWENPEVFSVGAEPARASFARDAVSLNGEWLFKYVHETADRPRDFYKTGYDFSGWDTI